jgi:hypothetical protein
MSSQLRSVARDVHVHRLLEQQSHGTAVWHYQKVAKRPGNTLRAGLRSCWLAPEAEDRCCFLQCRNIASRQFFECG